MTLAALYGGQSQFIAEHSRRSPCSLRQHDVGIIRAQCYMYNLIGSGSARQMLEAMTVFALNRLAIVRERVASLQSWRRHLHWLPPSWRVYNGQRHSGNRV